MNMNVFSPASSMNVFAKGAQIGAGLRQAKTDSLIAPKIAAGDYQGAAQVAGSRGDVASAEHYRNQYADVISSMSEQQRAEAMQRSATLAKVAIGAQQLPYEQRKPYIMQQANLLAGLDIGVEQLDQFDPTDEAINGVITQARDLDDLLKPTEYYAPVETDGGFTQFSKDGSDPRSFEGITPAQEPTKYSFEQIGEEIYAIDPTNPTNRMLVGDAPKKTPLSTTTINMPGDKRESKFAEKLGENAANNLNTILEEGKVANNSIAKADMMEALLDEVDYTGFGGNSLFAAQRALRALGVDVGDDIGAKEAVSALTKEMGLALKQDLPGPMSNADREFLMSIPPGINVTDAGNDALLFMYRARNQYASQLSSYMYEVNPRTEQEYNDAVRKFNMEYGPIFSEQDKRDLMAALTGTSP